jgi:hypothetical protein
MLTVTNPDELNLDVETKRKIEQYSQAIACMLNEEEIRK